MKKRDLLYGLIAGLFVSIMCINIVNALPIFKRSNEIPFEEKLSAIMDLLDIYYVEELDTDTMNETALAGLVAGVGDPYTTYFTKEQYSSYLESTDGSFSGIGVEVTTDTETGGHLVIAPIVGSPAFNSGILPQDYIVKVNDEDVTSLFIDEVVSKIRGKIGDSVKVTVYRKSTNEYLDFDIVRATIEVSSISSKIVDQNIGYINLSQFNENTFSQFKSSYEELVASNVKGLVIDVRNNPGGLVSAVKDIADYILPEGIIVYTINKNGKRVDYVSDANAIDLPIVLLINESSASCSEILAGAFKDMDYATLVGTKTFGKGVVQGLFELNDGSGIKITLEKYYTPNGISIHGIGVEPDYLVELPEEFRYSLVVDESDDTQLQKALEVLKEQII